MATVTRKGQITLPKRVRDVLGLEPGAEVEFDVQPGAVILRKRVPTEAFERWRGFLRGQGETLQAQRHVACGLFEDVAQLVFQRGFVEGRKHRGKVT